MGAEYWVQQRVASCPYEQPSLLNDVIGSSKINPQEHLEEHSHKNSEHSQERSQESKNAEKVHGLEFHFDKDEDAAEQLDEWIHPKYSTATYLDAQIKGYPAGGAPLIVFQTSSEEDEGGEGDEGEEEEEEEEEEEDEEDDDAPELVNLEESLKLDKENKTRSGHQKDQREENDHDKEGEEGEDEEEELYPTTPLSAWIIFPVVNRHVSFPGMFLHGVAGELLQPSLLLKSHQNNDIYCNSKGNNNQTSNENSNEYDNNNSSNDNGKTNSEKKRKRKISEEKSIKLDGNSDKVNLTGKCYNYSRLSLLVNVWTTHHPKAVDRLDMSSFNSQFEKEQQIEMEMKIGNGNKSVKNDENLGLKFNFNDFIENLDNDNDRKCLSFTPSNSSAKYRIKITENLDMESKDPRSSLCNLKLKLKLSCTRKVDVEEGVDDGVIRMMGIGIDESNIRVCHVDVPSQSEGKDDGEKADNRDCNINNNDNNSVNNNDHVNRRPIRLPGVEHNKAKNNKENIQDKVTATPENNKNNPSDCSDDSDIYFLREHRPGDTAPVPLKPLREEFQNSSKIGLKYAKIIHVKYNYAEASTLLFG